MPEVAAEAPARRLAAWAVLHASNRGAAPGWMADGESEVCLRCGGDFNAALRRRHHCRCCGWLICSECSAYVALAQVRTAGGFVPAEPGCSYRICSDHSQAEREDDSDSLAPLPQPSLADYVSANSLVDVQLFFVQTFMFGELQPPSKTRRIRGRELSSGARRRLTVAGVSVRPEDQSSGRLSTELSAPVLYARIKREWETRTLEALAVEGHYTLANLRHFVAAEKLDLAAFERKAGELMLLGVDSTMGDASSPLHVPQTPRPVESCDTRLLLMLEWVREIWEQGEE